MDDADTKEEFLVGWAIILVVVKIFLEPVFLEGPVIWYLAGALAVLAILTVFAVRAERKAARTPTFWAKASSATITDVASLVRNFAIAAGAVLVIQMLLHFFGSDVDPTAFGTAEQKVWEALLWLKRVGSLGAASAIVGGAILLSVVLHTYRPLEFAVKFRKGVSWCAALLAGLMMFTFVTARAADAAHERLTGPIRAQIALSLTKAAAVRKQAAAYGWISQTITKLETEEPEKIEATQAYFTEGERFCDDFERVYDEATPTEVVPVPASPFELDTRLQPNLGVFTEPPVERPRRKIVIRDICNKPQQFTALAQHLINPTDLAGTMAPTDPSGGGPNPDMLGEEGRPAEEVPVHTDSAWLPEFSGRIADRSYADTGYIEDLALTIGGDVTEPTVEVEAASWEELQELKTKAEQASAAAEMTRGVLRGLATKSAAKLIGKAFALDGVAGELVDSLRDAVLGELIKRGESKLKGWLVRGTQGKGVIASASAFMQRSLFPELPLQAALAAAKESPRSEAKQVWDSQHPEATTVIAVAAAARVAAHAAITEVRVPRVEPRPNWLEPRPMPRPPRPVVIRR
jgi:hypothetical protein